VGRVIRTSRAPAILLACAALAGAPARAVVCTPDPVPAATLLLPYFDLDSRDLSRSKPKRATPLLAITNAGAAAVLARVTLWTDLSVPTLAFDVYLTGYDVEEVDLWKVFRGELPGDLAIPCNNGAVPTRQLPPEQIEALRLAHAGQPVPANGDLCSAVDHGDTLLRGYVTIDNSLGCTGGNTAVFPRDPGYFGLGGIAANENVLTGQYFLQSRKRKVAEVGRLVAIEAAPFLLGPGDATFYGRYVGYSGADAREPLPTTWGVRTLSDPATKRSTELLVWRSSEANQGPFQCASRGEAGWFPLVQNELVAFDDFENAEGIEQSAFPAEANSVRIGSETLPVTAPSGWLYLGLGASDGLQTFVSARIQQGAPSARGLVDATAFDPEGCRPAPSAGTPIP
jgi:hypothetical protein